ncbi:neuronal acetylcholine receptor subunit alpha-6-like [Babylonia areolata]|uniref:neuronal acetylcholine receptor subunit alpha-6-like n=1 Tax=Babylonia areolata TaxID=304850 RepID=UPI003FD152A1
MMGKSKFVENEENLRRALLSNYSTKVRPELKTSVYVSAGITSLNHLDIASQSMSVNLVFDAEWADSRLTWNSTDYGGLDSLVTAPEDIWTPPLVIENSVANLGVIGGKKQDATPVRLSREGLVMWIPPKQVTVSCEMTIAQYPFDTQTCHIILIGWTYPVSEMDMVVGPMDMSLFSLNGEFDLLNTSSYAIDVGGPQESDIFTRVYFQLTFRRKWQFYGQNLLMPIVLNSILMTLAFLVPVESGEKTGYCLTVLLSYVVFLTWITDNLPPVSTDTSVLQVYLAVILCLGCLATVLTTWILRLYHQPADKPLSAFYLALATRILVPLRDCARLRKRSDESKHGGRDTFPSKATTTRIHPAGLPSPRGSGQETSCRGQSELGASVSLFTDVTSKPGGKEADVSDHREGEAREVNDTALTWQELAALLDFFLFCVLAVLMVIVTTVIFSLLYVNY